MNIIKTSQEQAKLSKELLTIFGGFCLLFAASQIEIPLKPVPITLQTVAVMLIGLTYTPQQALKTLSLWLGLGALGAPVFSGFGGSFAYMCGPTGGYLAGFLVSAYLMAYLKEKFSLNSLLGEAALCTFGTVLVFLLGTLWLSEIIGIEGAIAYGVLPFIIPGFIKIALLCTSLKIVRAVRNA